MDMANTNFPTDVITMNETSNNNDLPKRSVKSYATRVFQESTIGIVASIFTTHSRKRQAFKTLVFLLCISGFLYQCITFLIYVFQYPTVVDIDIKRPNEFSIPAYTFCSNNAIKRSLFCGMYEDRCYKPSQKFCSKFHSYCGNNETLIPKKQYYELEESMTHEEILRYGDDLNDTFKDDRSIIFEQDKPDGPYLRVKSYFSGAMICYSIHSVVENGQDPKKKKKEDDSSFSTWSFVTLPPPAAISYDGPTWRRIYVRLPQDTLVFYIEEDEMFIPGNRPGILFSIHSPFEAVNPFIKGIFMKPGRSYKIFVSMLQEVLLKEPFSTNCRNYEETFLANNRTGPRMQEMCQQKCMLDYSMISFKCVAPFILYPSEERLCDEKDINRGREFREAYAAYDDCVAACQDDCNVYKYTPEVMERYEVDYEEDENLDDYHRYITVEIYLEAGEIMTLNHSPKYMTVEVFSNIGGFIGCWLGIALMDIIDVLASIFTVSRYAFTK